MGLILTPEERLEKAERENKMLRAENEDLKAKLYYIAVCDYPEILDDEEVPGNAEIL